MRGIKESTNMERTIKRPFNHCDKCKHLRRAKNVRNTGGSSFRTFFEQLQAYRCIYRLWYIIPSVDTCEYFEHK